MTILNKMVRENSNNGNINNIIVNKANEANNANITNTNTTNANATNANEANDINAVNDINQQAGSFEEINSDINSDESQLSMDLEKKFSKFLAEFNVNNGFNVNAIKEPATDTMVEILSSKTVMVSITVLLSYIRYCINNGVKKDITIKIGYNKPPSIPMNFAINDEMLEDIYPGDVVEIN